MVKKKIKSETSDHIIKPKGDLKSVLQEMLKIKNNLASQSYSSLETRSKKLREELERLEEYDLLLTLYNWMFDCAYKEEKTNINKSVLEEFVSITQKAGVKQDHVEKISVAHILLSEAENGRADRVLLFESYNQLAKLLIRHNALNLKYKTLITILRICPFLENRNKYIDPYIDYVRHHISEIISYHAEDAHVLYYTLAVFSSRDAMYTRLSYIDQAIELAANHLIPDKEAYYRIGKSEIHCDNGDFTAAIKELEIVDHIIFTNMHFAEQLKNAAALSGITRLLISYFLELQNITIEKCNYKSILKSIEINGVHWNDFKARKNELTALLLLKKGDKKKATPLIKEAFLLREKDLHPQLSNINLLLHELLKEDVQIFWIKERIEALENSNELFYSSVWAGILKSISEFPVIRN
ncbi:MAG: hypothetical protein ACR2GN_10320 [Bacteroidia bacterium]